MAHRQTTPFTIYEDGLVFWGRIMESGCKWSMQVLEAVEQQKPDALEDDEPPALITASMIPATNDVEKTMATMVAAMNRSAHEKLDAFNVSDEPLEDVREAVARAKRSISAVKPKSDS
ncbi:hypothetical protein DX908_01625 [Parvularcula marina]|uniref:Uncharacterized protein n=3 Tax=Parvularcula marina TaxID=2292771 RepID=A0A371RF66_9PROT|nr:hypothetical protein DX908_01625 [Parvularcula marina]